MSQPPVISRILIVPGLPASSGRSQQSVNVESISVGLVINKAQVTWGELRTDPETLAEMQQKIVPLLDGRSLESCQTVLDELDALTGTAVISSPTPQPTAEKPASAISRRGFLFGKIESDSTADSSQQIRMERPLPATIRSSVSQLILTALATAHDETVAERIAAEYALPLRPAPVPIHLDINIADPLPDVSFLTHAIQSLGYTINDVAQLGPDGTNLQRFIRQLTNLLAQVTEPDYRPIIHLDVGGTLGQLFDHNAGRMLGALYGLEQVAAPFPLRVVDAALLPDATAQVALMRQLMDYVRLRGMMLQLAANQPIQSLADVQVCVDGGAAHLLELSLSRLGSVQQTIRAIQSCQKRGVAVLLRDEEIGRAHV